MDLMQKVNRHIYEIVPTIDDESLFTSKRYVEYLRTIAVGAINSVYTREAKIRGRKEFKRREKEARVKKLSIQVAYKRDDKNDIARTKDGDHIYINAGNAFVQAQKDRLFRHLAILGCLGHEQGHTFRTDFVAFRSWLNYILNGQWWPSPPADILSSKGILLEELMDEENLRQAIAFMAKQIWNFCEDGFVDNWLISVFPGLYGTAISLLNDTHINIMPTLEEEMKDPDTAPLLCVFNQILLYAKYGEVKLGNYQGELEEYINDCMGLLDAVRYEGDAKKRIECTNDILVILSPLVKDYAENYSHLYTPPPQPGQAPATTGQNGQQGGITQQQSQGMQDIFDRLAKGAGGSSIPDSTSKPVNADPVEPQKQPGGNPGQKGPGGNTGGSHSNQGPAQDLQRILQDMARNKAEELVEEERLEELNRLAAEAAKEGSGNIIVRRQTHVSDDFRDAYVSALGQIEGISRNLQQGILQILKDRRQGGKMKNKPFGRQLDPSSFYRRDGLHFVKMKLPNEMPPLFVGLLLDESMSMRGEGEQAALATAVCIEHFCQSLAIPHKICGYTSYGGGVAIESYAEPDKVDQKDCYRLMGIQGKNYTPTVRAMRYMLKSMEARPEDVKLLIVVSDGGAGDNQVYDEQTNDTDVTRLLTLAQRKNIKVIAAGIGSDRESVCEEFGENIFLDVSNLEEMPALLCKLVKRLLPVQ